MALKKILVGDYDGDGNGFHVEWNLGDQMTDPDGTPFVFVNEFIDLIDTPPNYSTANPGDAVIVNATTDGLIFAPPGGVSLETYDATGDITGASHIYSVPLILPVYNSGSVNAFVNGKKLLKSQVTENVDGRTLQIFKLDASPMILDPDATDGDTLEFLYTATF